MRGLGNKCFVLITQVERFPTDVTSESVVKAHEYALRKEHMFLGNPKAVNLIDKDNNCIEIIDDKRTVRIPFVNFNIIRKK